MLLGLLFVPLLALVLRLPILLIMFHSGVLRVSCMPGMCSATWATFPLYLVCFHFFLFIFVWGGTFHSAQGIPLVCDQESLLLVFGEPYGILGIKP